MPNCCKSPELRFAIHNGAGVLENDTRTTVTLPAGTIDAVGMERISNYLYNRHGYRSAGVVEEVGGVWQTKDGNFTKRLSHLVYERFAEKIPAPILSEVGTIASTHSTALDFNVEVTRELNMTSTAFGNSGSCWWDSHQSGRCALKSNGGFGMRAFDVYGNVLGRTWVMPLKKSKLTPKLTPLTPTFNTLTPEAFIVFNGYGVLSGYNGSRVLAHMTGWSYTKIVFTCSPMYVNSGVGYLVAPAKLVKRYTNGNLNLFVERHSVLHDSERELVNV